MTRYRFDRLTPEGSVVDVQVRDLPDDAAAVGWMGAEFLVDGERLDAFRGSDAQPFAQRRFGEQVEVFG